MISERNTRMSLIATMFAMIAGGMGHMKAINNSSNPKTLLRKLEHNKYGRKKQIGNNQRKRRKLCRQNTSLLKGKYKKYSR